MTGSLQTKRGMIYMVINTYEGKKRKPTWISTGLPEKGNRREAERMHKNIFNQPLVKAVADGLIPKNPCNGVRLPKSKRYEYQVYSQEQLRELFEALKDDPMLPIIKVTAVYGLRRSELLGLKWDSIDFQRDLITIRRTVCKVTTVVRKDKTKNSSSYRSFPLTPDMRELFLNTKAQQKKNQRLFGKQYQKSDYVFTWPDGHPYSPDYVTERFSNLLKNHGFPHIRFHELRHSCASILLSAGFTLKDVQEWLGHADIKMTANIYGHLDVERKKGIASAMSEKLSMQVAETG